MRIGTFLQDAATGSAPFAAYLLKLLQDQSATAEVGNVLKKELRNRSILEKPEVKALLAGDREFALRVAGLLLEDPQVADLLRVDLEVNRRRDLEARLQHEANQEHRERLSEALNDLRPDTLAPESLLLHASRSLEKRELASLVRNTPLAERLLSTYLPMSDPVKKLLTERAKHPQILLQDSRVAPLLLSEPFVRRFVELAQSRPRLIAAMFGTPELENLASANPGIVRVLLHYPESAKRLLQHGDVVQHLTNPQFAPVLLNPQLTPALLSRPSLPPRLSDDLIRLLESGEQPRPRTKIKAKELPPPQTKKRKKSKKSAHQTEEPMEEELEKPVWHFTVSLRYPPPYRVSAGHLAEAGVIPPAVANRHDVRTNNSPISFERRVPNLWQATLEAPPGYVFPSTHSITSEILNTGKEREYRKFYVGKASVLAQSADRIGLGSSGQISSGVESLKIFQSKKIKTEQMMFGGNRVERFTGLQYCPGPSASADPGYQRPAKGLSTGPQADIKREVTPYPNCLTGTTDLKQAIINDESNARDAICTAYPELNDPVLWGLMSDRYRSSRVKSKELPEFLWQIATQTSGKLKNTTKKQRLALQMLMMESGLHLDPP